MKKLLAKLLLAAAFLGVAGTVSLGSTAALAQDASAPAAASEAA